MKNPPSEANALIDWIKSCKSKKIKDDSLTTYQIRPHPSKIY